MLVFDLVIFTASERRSRAIDRYARKARVGAGGEEKLVLDAMVRDRFSIWRIERRHETAGIVVSDMLRGGELWLLEPALEEECEFATIAARICRFDDFAMTCGLPLPLDSVMLEEVASDPLAFRHADPKQVADDPRFAIAIYRAALDCGVLDMIATGDEDAERIDMAERDARDPSVLAAAGASA